MPMRCNYLVLDGAMAVASPGPRLDSQCRSQRRAAAGTFGQQPVPGKLEDVAAMLFDLALDAVEILADAPVRGGLVARHHRAVVPDIEREKRRQTPLDAATAQAHADRAGLGEGGTLVCLALLPWRRRTS